MTWALWWGKSSIGRGELGRKFLGEELMKKDGANFTK